LPLLGETLAFAKNPFRFIEERLAAHGGIFRSNVLGRDTVVLAGPDAAGQFVDDATGHRCPGLDFATYTMEIFAVVLLRSYAWALPPQNFDLDWSKTPPEPKEGLRARVTARST
jgi:cytochrome P450